jgi:hypothetical protein
MIVISSLSTRSPLPFPFSNPCIPAWIIYLFTGLAISTVSIVIAVLVLKQRKRKASLRGTSLKY